MIQVIVVVANPVRKLLTLNVFCCFLPDITERLLNWMANFARISIFIIIMLQLGIIARIMVPAKTIIFAMLLNSGNALFGTQVPFTTISV